MIISPLPRTLCAVELKGKRYQGSKVIIGAIKRGHPWIHRNALSSAITAIEPGTLVRIVDGANRFAANAVYEPHGSIAMRIMPEADPLTAKTFLRRVQKLCVKKAPFGDAFRLINGEGDLLPGLVCDVYGPLCVWQPYLKFWDPFLEGLAREVSNLLGEKSHLVKPPTHRRQKPYPLFGAEIAEPALFKEDGLVFCAFPLTGQKSGFFLDLKPVRRLLPKIVPGKKVLNCFANSGAFTLIAKRHGAKEILSVDADPKCRDQAERMMAANALSLSAEEWRTADAFDLLAELGEQGRRFDLVIIDPPNMCSSKSALKPALKGWEKLLEMGTALLPPGGLLLPANCSSFMERKMCEETIKRLGLKTVETGGLHPDHTVRQTFPEGDYLKWWLLKK